MLELPHTDLTVVEPKTNGMRFATAYRYLFVALAIFLLADAWFISGFLPDWSIQTSLQQWSLGSSTTQKLLSIALLALVPVILLRSKPITAAQKVVAGCVAIYVFACAGTILSSGQDILTASSSWSIAIAILIGLSAGLLLENLRFALSLISCLTLLLAIASIATYGSTDYVIWSGTLARAGGPFKRPEIVATLLVLTLPWMLAKLYDDNQRNPLPSVVEVSISGAALALTWMRDSFAAVGLAFASLAARDHRVRLVVPILVVFTALTFLTSAMRSNGQARIVSTDKSNQGHYKAWEGGLRAFTMRPLTGVGISALAIPIERESGGVTTKAESLTEPKSLYIGLLADLGVSGGLLVIAFVYGLVSHFRSTRDPLSNQLLASWLALAVLGLFDTVVLCDRFPSNVFFGLLVGLTMMSPRGPLTKPSTESAEV